MISISDADFDRAVEQALASIPAEFRTYLENVAVEVLPAPTPRILAEFDEEGGEDLLGLYVGVPLEDKGVEGGSVLPDRIYIFRDNLKDMCESRAELIDEIRVTVLHEIGHHFGLDEDRLEELGYE